MLSIVNKIRNVLSRKKPTEISPNTSTTQQIVKASSYGLTAKKIQPHVVKIIQRLEQAGFEAYIVGGGVRDLLLNIPPKDYDIATNAHPEQIRKLFRNCRLIGRRFRLAHIYFHDDIVEVATFRGSDINPTDNHLSDNGMILRDNVYGTLEEDVFRRDLTINAIYYDVTGNELIDFTGGLADIKKHTFHLIGDPAARYREDPVRILRVIRFAAKLNFKIAPSTAEPINELKELLLHVSSSRVFEEILKLFFSGHAQATLTQLTKYDLLTLLFPSLKILPKELKTSANSLTSIGCSNTDIRYADGRSLNPAFLFAVILWQSYEHRLIRHLEQHENRAVAQHHALNELFQEQIAVAAIPKRFTSIMAEMWLMQPRFEHRDKKRAMSLFEHPRFRAAYDLLLLRKEAGEPIEDLTSWWTSFQAAENRDRQAMFIKRPMVKRKK